MRLLAATSLSIISGCGGLCVEDTEGDVGGPTGRSQGDGEGEEVEEETEE